MASGRYLIDAVGLRRVPHSRCLFSASSEPRDAVPGGWTDMATMEKCYDLPGDEDMLKVTSETNKRRELVSMSISAAN